MFMQKSRRIAHLIAAIGVAALSGCMATASEIDRGPDLTKVLPADTGKLHNLGPTGLKGCMHVQMVKRVPGDMTLTPLTVNARQIYVARVAEGSPADGVIQVGDVILGIGDKPFDGDPRVALANAINEAEKTENNGILRLLCWSPDAPDEEGQERRPAGSSSVKELKLKVLGSYSDTAPYDCEKSELILKQAVEAMLEDRMSSGLELSYLALLATGEKEHFEIAKEHALSVAQSVKEPSIERVNSARSWGTGYRLILLCEYYLLTKDEAVLPAIEKLAITLSMGQSISGAWGHAMAQPSYNDGRLHGRIEGYAALNQPSLTCFLGLVLADKCGVRHPELKTALEKANDYFRHYVGIGAIPYGFGMPKEYMQSNNGTSGSAAIAFSARSDKEAATFFSVMCAGAQPKLEVGHTGPFFNSMWTGLGANVAGPETYAEFFKRWTWMRTLNRRWDGGYSYQSPGGGGNKYRGLSSDAAMILHLCLPRRKLIITGREADESLWLKGKDAVAAASVWDIDYAQSSEDDLVRLMDHDIPMVRGLAARELASRAGDIVEVLIPMLKGSFNEKIAACNALAEIKEKAEPALEGLMELVSAEQERPWVRGRAAIAVAAVGEEGHKYARELLGLLLVDRKDNPRRDFERYLAYGAARMVTHESFNYESHKDVIYPAARRLITHPHGQARRLGMRMIEEIGLDDFHLLADSIVEVIRNQNADYTHYHSDVPPSIGLAILNRLNIEEGIPLAIDTIYPGIWGQSRRITGPRGRLAVLKEYGLSVEPYFDRFRDVYGKGAEATIKEIEESGVTRELITLEEAKKTGTTTVE